MSVFLSMFLPIVQRIRKVIWGLELWICKK